MSQRGAQPKMVHKSCAFEGCSRPVARAHILFPHTSNRHPIPDRRNRIYVQQFELNSDRVVPGDVHGYDLRKRAATAHRWGRAVLHSARVRLAYGGDFEIRNMNVVTPRGNQGWHFRL